MSDMVAKGDRVFAALCRALIAAVEGRRDNARREIETAQRLVEGVPCEDHPMMPVHSGDGAARRAKLAAAGVAGLGK
jgi:hypothetical protein